MMDKKSRNFFAIFVFIIFLSILLTYYRYIVMKDFTYFTDENLFYEELSLYQEYE